MVFCKTMSNREESYNPRLIIDNHFTGLINLIDVKTEELLLKSVQHESDSSNRVNELNDLRDKQIKKIDEVKYLNLKSFEHFNENEYEYENKWLDLINDPTLEYGKKIDRIKEEIISVDCVLLEQSKVPNGLDLWITDWFFNSKNLEITQYDFKIFKFIIVLKLLPSCRAK